MAAYYNEHDLFAADWLRNLIAKGLIPDGEVDTRSIVDVQPDDIRGFRQCHFFAGIGGWSHALRLAGWPDDRPVWTGSCPCQPFSVAGKGKGTADERHLWPEFFRLIRDCRPPVVMGEQVAGAAGYGWLDGVRTDLEAEDYACRGVDIPACCLNAPHIRQRLYWLAVGDADALRKLQPQGRISEQFRWAGDASSDGMGAAISARLEGHARHGDDRHEPGRLVKDAIRPVAEAGSSDMEHAQSVGWREGRAEYEIWSGRSAFAGAGSGFWSDYEWLVGADGKARRAQSGIRLLAHGVPGRVGRLRGYGNAIVPPLAAEVIRALMEVCDE